MHVQQTLEFAEWLSELRDLVAARKIADRIFRVRGGLMGDVKYFDGIGEFRINMVPGTASASRTETTF